ncbi:PREDICTED: circadian clock-controlled protein-like [Drosophila arizonae]|uniref:Circadian clock-controlled protein-like n=1 Tax=Drosophila arizonae TaxID=7263 RepID=A0ABM1Q3W6_DROAR|nr:PREDICTED: circadian clock-controlled protein-like [Drosophila arizonae]
MHKYSLLFVILLMLYKTSLGIELPDDIKKCHFGDSQCLINTINDLIRRYPNGIPGIGLAPLNVTQLDDISIVNRPNGASVWLSFYLQNLTNKGFNNATITQVIGFNKDPSSSSMIIKAHIPRLIHKGTYNMLSRILLFRANATGSFCSEFLNFRLEMLIKTIQEYRNNKRYLRIYELKPKVDLQRWIISLDSLYTENTDMTIVMNNVINENWLEFWQELEPSMLKTFELCLTLILKRVFDNVAYDDLFLPDEY